MNAFDDFFPLMKWGGKFDESKVRRDKRGRFARQAELTAASAAAHGAVGAAVGAAGRYGRLGRGRAAAIGGLAGATYGAVREQKRRIERERLYGQDFEGGYKSVKEIRNALLAHGDKSGRERAIIVDEEGRVAADRIGGSESVMPYGPYHIVTGVHRKRSKMYHNHPVDILAPPSGPDILALKPGDVGVVYGEGRSIFRFGKPSKEDLIGTRARHLSDEKYNEFLNRALTRHYDIEELAKKYVTPYEKEQWQKLQAEQIALAHAMVLARKQGDAEKMKEIEGRVNDHVKRYDAAMRSVGERFSVMQHGFLSGLRNGGVVKYRYRLSDADKQTVARHQELFEQTVRDGEKAADRIRGSVRAWSRMETYG